MQAVRAQATIPDGAREIEQVSARFGGVDVLMENAENRDGAEIRACILIPTYNNEKTISEVIAASLQVGLHVFVVDDGATDLNSRQKRQLATWIVIFVTRKVIE